MVQRRVLGTFGASAREAGWWVFGHSHRLLPLEQDRDPPTSPEGRFKYSLRGMPSYSRPEIMATKPFGPIA
jgi:hypothetical protein